MKLLGKPALSIALGAIVGNFIAERWILKRTEDGPGFVMVADGFGMDDIVRAALIAATALTIRRFLPGSN